MNGLMKSNYYAVQAEVKVFLAVMLAWGIIDAAMKSGPALAIGYMVSCMVGFSVNAAAGFGKEGLAKWTKYKLTAPVRRSDIVKSYFVSLLIWLFVGMLLAGMGMAAIIVFQRFPLDKEVDLFMVYVIGAGISLFMGAIFFPLFCMGNGGRNEIILIVSLLFGIGSILGLSAIFNTLLGPDMTTLQVILGGVAVLALAAAAYGVSYAVTVSIFKRKEY